jgi:hypothetical protein
VIGDSKIKRRSTGDMDYFEQFTLVDAVVPDEQAPELQQEVTVPAVTPHGEKDRSGGLCARDDIIHTGRQLWRSFRESYSSRHLLHYYISCNTIIPIHFFVF